MPDVAAHRPVRRSLKAWLAAGVVAALAVTGLTVLAQPALADPGLTGVIEGTVYEPDGVTAVGANNAVVIAYQADQFGGSYGQVATDASGHWEFDQLPSGDWAFEVVSQDSAHTDYVGGFTTGEYSFNEVYDAYDFLTLADDDTSTLDFTLLEGATISGQVTGTAGVSLADVDVALYRFTSDGFGSYGMQQEADQLTDLGGGYSFAGLKPGTYTLGITAPAGYASEFWDSAYVDIADAADTFDLSPGDVFPADVQLVKASKVSGTVKNAAGKGFADVQVQALTFNGFDWEPSGIAATTAANGTYTITDLAPGTYRVAFFPPNGSYLVKYWPNATTAEAGTSFTVLPGGTKTGVNATLTKSSVVSGKIALTGSPTPPAESDIDIALCPAQYFSCDSYNGDGVGSVHYNETTGAYSVDSIAAGSYNLHVGYSGSGNFRDEFYDNRHDISLATKIVVGSAATASGKNVTLDPGAQISGTVSDGVSGVEGISVDAYLWKYGYAQYVKTAYTDGDGAYTISGLGEGPYLLQAVDENTGSYSSRWYGDTYQQAKATKVDTTVPQDRTGTDITIETGGTVHGDVLASNGGDPIDASVDLYRFDSATGSYFEWDLGGSGTYTDENGHYEIVNLPPGFYAVRADSFGGYLGGFWNSPLDVKSASQAARFEVTPGGDVDASFSLDLGGTYTGRIVDSHGDPVEGVGVSATDGFGDGAYSESDGTFFLSGLRPGTHTLRIDTGDVEGYVNDTLTSGPATTVNALPIDLGDITLEDASTIHGVVKTAAGVVMKDVRVDAYSVGAGGELLFFDEEYSAADGTFDLDGLPTDAVYLEFNAPSTSYPRQYLGGSPIWSLSSPVVFAAPGSATVEARLVTGGSITGVVKNKVTGKVIAGVEVGASQNIPGTDVISHYDGAMTNSKGAYVIPGLDAGGYDVSFNAYATGPSLPYGSSTTTTTVPDKGIATVNASLVPTSKVSGTIRRAGSLSPVVDGLVIAENAAGDTLQEWTNASGGYSIQLPNGVWTLHFSDSRHLAAAAYFRTGSANGADSVTNATKLTVTGNGAAFAGRNVDLPATTASLTAHIFSAAESDPSGQLLLQRMDGSDVVSSELFYVDGNGVPLDTLFPITNVVPGTYRFVIDGQSGLGDGGYYPHFVSSTFVVGPTGLTDAGAFDIGTPELLNSDLPDLVAGSEPQITGDPTIGGAGLDVSTGTWTPTPKYYFFQWTRNGKPIPGANAQNYVPTPGDAGKTIAVLVGASDYSDYYEFPYAYTATLPGTIAPASAPSLLVDGTPLISGKPYVGQTLSVSTGQWDTPKLTFSYQWYRNTVAIPGAIAATYKAVAADVGADLTVEVTTHRTGFDAGHSGQLVVPFVQPAVALKATKLPVVSAVTTPEAGWKVTSGTWTPTGASFAYEWTWYDSTGAAHPFAGGPTATVAAAGDLDTRVTVKVTASKPGYTTTTVEIQARAGAKPFYDVAPTLNGGSQVGQPVTVTGGVTWPSGAVPSYQWYLGTAKIAGASAATYLPKAGDVGKSLSVKIALKATGHTAQTAADALTLTAGPVIAADPLVSNDDASVTGVLAVGRVLTAVPGTWSATPSFTYQWTRNGTPISKATAAKYTLTATDLGKEVAVTIKGTVGTQTDTTVAIAGTVAAQGVANVTPPALPATARVGLKLTATTGTWEFTPTSFTYQWYLNDTAITGAKSSSYTPVIGDLGEELSVKIVAKRTGFPDSAPTQSVPVTVLEGSAMVPTKATSVKVAAKTVTTVKLGATIVATPATWPSGANITSGWEVSTDGGVSWVAIPGSSGTSYQVESPLVAGDKVRFAVTATRAGYSVSMSASAPLTVIP